MRIEVLQHVPFEGPANVGVWARERGHALDVTNLHRGQPLPEIDAFDMLVVLGGLMSVWEEDRYPWLPGEKRFLRQTIDAGKKVIGICLGAQLLAECLGGQPGRNEYAEIGWGEVTVEPQARRRRWFADWPKQIEAFHWHGDTFTLPDGAERIAHSEGCLNQGFVYGETVIATQFHLEYSVGSIELMLNNCPDDLSRESPHVNTIEQIRHRIDRRVRRAGGILYSMLDSFAG